MSICDDGRRVLLVLLPLMKNRNDEVVKSNDKMTLTTLLWIFSLLFIHCFPNPRHHPDEPYSLQEGTSQAPRLVDREAK